MTYSTFLPLYSRLLKENKIVRRPNVKRPIPLIHSKPDVIYSYTRYRCISHLDTLLTIFSALPPLHPRASNAQKIPIIF